MRQKLICIAILIAFSFFIVFPTFANNDVPVWSNEGNSISNKIENTSTNETSEDTAAEVADDNFLNLESGSAILIEQTTGQVLYSHNSHEQLRPASVTKVMSILLIMEQIEKGALSYDDQIPCSENASSMGGSQIWLDTTETLSVDEMLKAICVVSANDYAVRF